MIEFERGRCHKGFLCPPLLNQANFGHCICQAGMDFQVLKQLITHFHLLSKLDLDGKIVVGIRSGHHDILCQLPTSLAELDLSNLTTVVLEKPPNLRLLSLSCYSYWWCKMVCSVYGFPMLETLHLKGLDELVE